MAGSAPSDKVKDKEYSNWLKVTLALYYMKSGLHTFIQSEIDCLHQTLVQKIYGGKTVPLPPCTMCCASHVQRNKYSKVWTFSNQCQSYCDVWLHELLALHTNPKSEKIYWNNCHIASWPFKPWECAKVFMPRGQLPSNVGPTECDAQAMLTMLANCTHFHQKLSQQGLGLTHSISSIRNKVMHDGEMKLSDADRSTFIQQIIQLLEDPVSLKSTEDCKAAVGNILKINNDSLDVSFNMDIEIISLKSAVKELWLQYDLQEKKLETVDSWKEEYKQLIEHITDVEKRMDSIERSVQSVKEQTDNAQSQNETKHQEMQAAVTSNRARLDTVEENVEYIDTRMDTIEKSVHSAKTQTDMTLQQHENIHQELHTNVTSHGERLNKVEETVQYFGTELQGLKANIPTQMENNSCKKKPAEERTSKYNILETSAKRRPETDGLRQLKCQTEDILDTFRSLEYISTIQAKEAKKTLDEKCFVLIKGNPGEGKTMVALYLINNEIYRNSRVVLKHPGDWKMVDTDWVDIVVLEDMFGQFDFDPGYLKKWMLYLPQIQEHVDAGKLRVIITIRNDILLKAYSKLTSIKLFCDDVSLTMSSEKLKQSEKMSILNKELQRRDKNMKQDDKEKCIVNFSGFIGFPKCCSLFAEDNMLFSRGPDFFKSPAQYFVENITELKETTRFLSLAFIFCNGEIYEEYLSPKTMPKSSKKLLKELSLCLEIKDWKASIKLLKDGYDSRLGLYIVKYTYFEFRLGSFVTKPCIRFSHAVVAEAVGRVLGHYPEAIVKYGNSEFLYQKTTAETKDITSRNVFIPESVYGILAERMVQDVVEKGHTESVVKHSALRQDLFVLKLKHELHRGNRVKDFFTDKLQIYMHQDLIEGECITFLQHLLQSDKDVFISIHSQFLEFLACMHRNNRTDCWQCREKQNLLELALYYHHFETADKLIDRNACYTYTSLCNAARHGDLSRVQSILEILKSSHIFSPVCGVAKHALCRAYISGNKDVIEFFINEGITLDEKHLIYVVNQTNVNNLMPVIEHLKCHNNWNPHLEKYWRNKYFSSPSQYLGKCEPCEVGTLPYSIALYIAYCNEEFDIACHLQENGINVSMEMLPGVLRYSSKDSEAVSRLIQTLIDRDIWDSNHCDAIAALQISYTQQKYDVCNILIQFGVSLTMESVPGVIVHQRAPSAKRVIQHLKDTKSWEPRSHYAYKALENAYSQGAYDVCDVLVEEGVSMTMKHLPLVILRPSDYVKTAVTKLKDSICWDPKCDYATIALEHAYSERNYDVCDLLIREGVSITIKHLPLVILRPSQYVKTAVTQLKYSNSWDPKCDYAARALEQAYSERNYDVCDLLVQEGVSLTMKNLSHVVCHHNASSKSVQKVIEHLKDTDSWDPKSVYAAQALQHAYRRRTFDVYDLLIDEGLQSTMKTLPFMASLDYVRKAIQQLKDTANWDPKCDYASRALQYACRHHTDVYDLLLQQGVSLTMENLTDLICNNEASIQSVKEAIQHLKKARIWDQKCDDASEAFKYAYIMGKYDVCDVLTQEGVSLTMKNLPTVVWVHISSVIKAIEHLKYTGNWDPGCEDASKSLEYAYIKERYDVCDLLVHEGVSLTMKNLPCKNKSYPSFVSIKKTIQHLQNIGNWDPKCDHAYEALAMAYAQEKYDVCDLLFQEGVSLEMNNLTFLAQLKNVSFVSVKKAIQHIKGTDNWDPKSIHASKALECAYYKQAYGVCDVLVEEGVLLTMQTFPYVIMEIKTPTESVKKVIKQLKDSANWDPKSDYASLALAKAYATKKNDVCDLLLQEGITLTMKNIHNVVCEYTASVESVQKTIQHLKEVNKWDLEYYDASEALANNYIKENYDVCDLLIQEGLSLTMKYLPSIICNHKESIKLFMKVAQPLNDAVSWAPCANASVSLANMCVEEKHDVHSMDVGEAESLQMKKLYTNVCIDKSVESIKKIIQHLKDTGNWDQKCDHASEALAMAYAQEKYDACDLLVQERVMITMKNLCNIVLQYKTSAYSVKKAIKNLKDFVNIDSEYLALAIAYVQEKYDVCDLLVQEGSSLTMKILHKVTQKNKTSKHDNPFLDLIKTCVKEEYEECDMHLREGVSLIMMNFGFVLEMDKASFESLQKIIQHLKETGNWIPKCDDASIALVIAYRQEKYDVCDLLVKEGVCLTTRNLPILLLHVETSFASVKKTIQHLKDTDNWDPKSDHASGTLAMAYAQEKHDVYALLVEEGVSITMRTLAFAAQNITKPFEYLKTMVRYLKCAHIWDPKSHHASLALAIAYVEKKYDVCDLLIHEGVSLTMRNLCFFMQQNETSVESVEKAIQHLKDTETWNTRCDHALAVAYVKEKYDVCHLLVQEGVSLTMVHLYFVVENQTSIESVKKTIQHLKDTDNWNITCFEASLALMAAYVHGKYDVCDLLDQEGVSLTMKWFTDVVPIKPSVESAMKTQHLKYTDNCNIRSDHAFVASAVADVQEKYMCGSMNQECVSPTMRNFDAVVQIKPSVESVMKIIQHLKDTDNWDPKCDHASRTLANAYVLKMHYVCDLLEQEGVELTMKNFAFVVKNQASVQFVKKAIQYLKDIGKWNPSCDDAMNILCTLICQKRFMDIGMLAEEGFGVKPVIKHTILSWCVLVFYTLFCPV